MSTAAAAASPTPAPNRASLVLPPTSQTQVVAVLRFLGLPVLPKEAISALGGYPGNDADKYAHVMAQAVAGNEGALNHLKSAVAALSPKTTERLGQLGFPVPSFTDLITISRKYPAFGFDVGRAVERNDQSARDAVSLALASFVDGGGEATNVLGLPSDAEPPAASASPTTQSRAPAQPAARASAPSARNQPAPAAAPAADREPMGSDVPLVGDEGVSRSDREREFISTHAYGKQAALCISADVSQGAGHKVVRVEAALATGERQYDWQSKVALQMTVKEMPLLLGVFLGFLPKFEANNHGKNNEKGMSAEDQGTHVFVSVRSANGGARGVPVPAGDIYPIVTLLLRQMQLNDPHLTVEQILKLSYRVCQVGQGKSSRMRAAA